MRELAFEPVETLSVGSVVGGATPANQPWREAIRELALGVAEARSGVESPLNVNVVFHVPGNLMAPKFQGTRTGRFSKRESLLMVQVALPKDTPPDVTTYLKEAAHEAIGEAERWVRRHRTSRDLSHLRAVLDRA